ncbi:uncharacterized protein LOC106178805 [Lingula anatina]|uniref:Uncharacterized protein LOC106178805 n=1 Tax=Lingula anatina TaxID=7574 RepID=A0A1S3K5B4_LINAN|nr:uncharacterized protein LOC106178805 [Lingula anatina]|eukprot:XP_013417609.2 uncharacterized protein LOC106178805 [Lingula anatina]
MTSVSDRLREIDNFLAQAKKDEEFAKLSRKLVNLECQCRELNSKLKELIKEQQAKGDTIRRLQRHNREQVDKIDDLKQANRDLRWRIQEHQRENHVLKTVLYGNLWNKCKPGEPLPYMFEYSKISSEEKLSSDES